MLKALMCINYSPSPVRLRRHDLFVEQLDGAKGVPLPSNCTQREKTPLSDYKKHTNYKIKTKKSVKNWTQVQLVISRGHLGCETDKSSAAV